MSFLAPLLLFGLPLAALPILIHLINQRRFQNIDWGAMRFLLEANRMSRGFARIRQWLILLLRTLAIAALVLAVARPLARGALGLLAGGRADTTLILLDRSASMSQRGPTNVASKVETGTEQLANLLTTLGASHWVLIDSVSLKPYELESPQSLVESPATSSTSATTDVPVLLQAAYDYMRTNRTGQTEIWICSDLRASDWNAANSQWATLRDAFRELPQGVRFHLLAYPEPGNDNLSIRVTDVRRQQTSQGLSLLVSLTLRRAEGMDKQRVPIEFEIDGVRSILEVEMEGPELTLQDHAIPLESHHEQGWGRVSIPADVNPADNEYYFAFAEPADRRTVIVSDDETNLRPVQLAAMIAPHSPAASTAAFIAPDALATVPWEEVALVVWQAPLPTGDDAELIHRFVERGGQAVFLPPDRPTDAALDGVRWLAWQQPDEPVGVESWRGDEDLLARTQSGEALPLGELQIRRFCQLQGKVTPLATLYGGGTLLARAASRAGGLYFLTTTTSVRDSSLATNGIVLYAALQRAVRQGAESLSKARQLSAGPALEAGSPWQQIAGAPHSLSTEYSYCAGAYAEGNRILAVNRGLAEDRTDVLDNAQINGLFQGLDFDRLDDEAGNVNSLAREVWRLFLVGMLGSLVGEAALCMPKRPKAIGELV